MPAASFQLGGMQAFAQGGGESQIVAADAPRAELLFNTNRLLFNTNRLYIMKFPIIQ